MKMVTFNAFRTIGMPNVRYIKPDLMFQESDSIQEADICLFPETWQVPALVYGWKKAIFPSIESLQLGFSKIEMTRALWTVAKEHVPYTEILANTATNRAAILDTFPFPFVAKEVRNSMGRGTFLIENEEEFYAYADTNSVLYIQSYLENDGKDIRICVIGDDVYASYWRIGLEGEFLHNVAKGGELCYDFIPPEAINLVRDVARKLNINHAGFDVMISDGKLYILEFNVLFGNQGLKTQGLSVEQAIYHYIQNQFHHPFPTSPLASKKTIS
ncbi:hypothetical protein Pryu01_01098 [Paraliobacillus ryukyuensis]|uniref:Ribosomal protein S6--L-glutamate ligase n=1 Tax=Paraliobacillus ryukyuensis TaxID=200904 RepID=A0A366EF23_9BACI|nr:alpha-L-glutamate ligase [Paraliobacillus ryukyuensis]RBP00330.1 ribosomal protein S6--L-glutamate ligase [Paraliobacillus ryukyuensis]